MRAVDETELVDALAAGEVFDCAQDGSRRPVPASLVRQICRSGGAGIDPHGFRLRNAAIVGDLDLAGIELAVPLRFEACAFDSPLICEGASLHALAVTDCPAVPGLLGNGLRVRRDLDLSGSVVTGAHRTVASTSRRSAVWLCEADIGGRLLCLDTRITADGERAVQADRLHVGGNVRLLHAFTAVGEVRLIGVTIDGSLDLTGARILNPDGLALDLADATIGGSFFLIDDADGPPTIQGRIDLNSARVAGQLLIRDAVLREPPGAPVGGPYAKQRSDGTAVSAPRLTVGADVSVEGACDIEGGIDLSMSQMSSLSVTGTARLNAPRRTALNLTNAQVDSTLRIGDGVQVLGTVDLTATRIRGDLTLRGAVLSGADGGRPLLAANGAKVEGSVQLRGLRATGGSVNFFGADIGSFVEAAGAELTNPGNLTLSLHQASVRGSVRLIDGFRSTGHVNLTRAIVDGRLDCRDGEFIESSGSSYDRFGHAISASSAAFRGGMYLAWRAVDGSVDFTSTSTTVLADDPRTWPGRYSIAGLSYDRFGAAGGEPGADAWDSGLRRAWLRGQADYDAGPYEQAARVFRQHGYARQAEQILIDQRADARRSGPDRSVRRTLVDAVYGFTVGYGFRPGRVLWALVALLVAVVVSLQLGPLATSLRATDARGNVYAVDGRLVTVDAVSPSAPGQAPGAGGSTAGGSTADGAAVASTQRPAPDGCGAGQVRCFNPYFYALDTVIPLISLDQRSTWYPDPHAPSGRTAEWWLDLATLAGWLLSSVVVLSFARLARTL
ncbi:hypothetical protein [Rugosimonospora africana]|uniref:hypothetical protein n=1 Tax=Rugosimonospora africana TaxID=556532 RepID=UPI00194239BB|nr:hypothetical protein [Rugosimonospora africana]